MAKYRITIEKKQNGEWRPMEDMGGMGEGFALLLKQKNGFQDSVQRLGPGELVDMVLNSDHWLLIAHAAVLVNRLTNKESTEEDGIPEIDIEAILRDLQKKD